MTKAQEKKLDKTLKEEFTKMHDLGMARGAKAMCKTIEDIVDDSKLNDTEKLSKVKHFCVVALGEDRGI